MTSMKKPPAKQIAERVWLIDEFGGNNCYLVLGSERALLIDCGTGFCDQLWMMLPGRTSLEEWLPSAKWLLEMSRTHDVYWAHREKDPAGGYVPVHGPRRDGGIIK